MRTKIIIGLFICIISATKAFPQNEIKPLTIGNKAPDYVLTNMLNYRTETANLADFNKKIIILDFWDFYCSPCIQSWPKLLKLQEKFKNDIQIILVNPQESDTNKIKAFVEKREKTFGYDLNLPMANGDKQLNLMFPHSFVPHVVWIDKQKTIKYITSGAVINEVVIQNLIDGRDMKIGSKTDEKIESDPSKPLFINGNGIGIDNGSKAFLTSIVNPYSPDLAIYAGFGVTKQSSYGYIGNHEIKSMIRLLFFGRWHQYASNKTPVSFPAARTIIEMADSTKIIDAPDGSLNNRYTIQLTAQSEIPIAKIQQKMLLDLMQCFNLKVSMEKRVKKCLVISRNTKPITTYHDGEKTMKVSTSKLIINNVNITELLNILGSGLSTFNVNLAKYPIVDETHFAGSLGKISAENINMNNIDAVGKLLGKHGFKFSFENKNIDVLVIRDDK